MKTFLGIISVLAAPQAQEGQPGYAVQNEDGQTSWVPATAFEAAYQEVPDITSETAPALLAEARRNVGTLIRHATESKGSAGSAIGSDWPAGATTHLVQIREPDFNEARQIIEDGMREGVGATELGRLKAILDGVAADDQTARGDVDTRAKAETETA